MARLLVWNADTDDPEESMFIGHYRFAAQAEIDEAAGVTELRAAAVLASGILNEAQSYSMEELEAIRDRLNAVLCDKAKGEG
jgi:hypothetical protein